MSYIGNPIITTDYPVDTFSGNGSTTAFTLSLAPASVNSILVAVSGVIQDPSTYSVSSTTLTFTAAPPSGTGNISVRHLGVAGIPNTPSAASVQYSSLNSSLQGTLVGKNRIINGAMQIDQRNAGSAVTINSTADKYSIDRWYGLGQSTDGVFTLQQNAGSVTPPVGFINYLGATVTTADASIGATQVYRITQAIEGLNCTDLAWGTANAKTVTLSFWVRSSLTGTFGGSIANSGFTRAYPYSYSISSANTWEYKTITVAGDTTGTWLTTNGVGVYVSFAMGMGSTYTGTANAWNAGLYFAPTGNTNIISTNGATFYITGVQLEVGSTATSFDYRPYTTELQLCQRYLPAFNTFGTLQAMFPYGAAYSTTKANTTAQFLVTPRTSPTGLTTTGSFSVSDGVTAIAATAVAFGGSGFNNCFVDITVASGLTQYRSVYLYTTTSNSQILFTGCEL